MNDPRGLNQGRAQQAEALEQFHRKSKLYARVFSTPEGKEVLRDLQQTYMRRPMRSDVPHDVVYMAGQHDVVLSIEEKIKTGNREDDTDGVV